MKKYVATRKEICTGRLMMPCDVSVVALTNNNQEIKESAFEKLGISKISVSCGVICRGMLFNVNENNLANDLIYKTPTNYTVSGLESSLTDGASNFIIDNYVELDELLKYLKYGIDLTQHDLDKIYQKLVINNRWLSHHMELFGWKKCGHGIYVGGGKETFPMQVYDNLSSISCSKKGKPYREEPGYQLIKKRK